MRVFNVLGFIAYLACFSIYLQADTLKTTDRLRPIEEARLRVFEFAYQKELDTRQKRIDFLNKNFKSTQEYDIYTFPNLNIQSAYGAYIKAKLKDSLGDSFPYQNLPEENKSFNIKPTDKNSNSYILMYNWEDDSKKLIVSSQKINKNKETCAEEILEINQDGKDVVLKSHFELYCFDK